MGSKEPNTAWKVSKCKVISGPYFPVFVFGHFSRSVNEFK